MKKLIIYDVHVEMQDQAQCDRMKQLCIDNGLEYWKNERAFNFLKTSNNYFELNYGVEFGIYDDVIQNKTKVTEQEFIELLKNK